jgi:hypothetical protein
MAAEVDGRVIATARYNPGTAAGGEDECIVSGLPHRAIARELNLDRRKVKRILDQTA